MVAPKLRFRDENGEVFSEWASKPLGAIAKVYDGTHQTPNYVENGIPFFSVEHITSDNFSKTKYISPQVYEDECKRVAMEKGDILMTRIGDIGSVKYLHWEPKASFYVSIALIKVNKNTNPKYVSFSLQSEKFQRELHERTIHVAFPKKINLGEISNCLINYPGDIREQTKIADFLSSVDEKIALKTKQYQLLCQYKKGMMQKIFSQELRFKDENGEEFAEWESKLFTNIYKFISTNSLSRSELNYENGSIKNIHYGDIHTKLSVNFDVKKENIPFIIKSIKVPDEQYCKENDLIIADASEDYKDVGKCIEIIATNDEKIVAGLHTFLARPQIDVARGFGGYMMQSEIVRKPIKIMATGVSVLSISKKNLSNLQLKMPCKQEQTKIADFLTAIDDKITAAKKQLEQLKQWKQGLLQQMFI